MILDRHRHDLGESLSQRGVALLCGTRHNGVESLTLETQRRSLIEHGEIRRDFGLEREALQQPLAESVNGVDLEPAFGLQRLRKEPSRRFDLYIVGSAAEKGRKPLSQCAVFQRGPRR